MKNKMIFSLHAQEFVVMQNKTDLYFSCVERFLYLVSNIFSNAMFEFFAHSYTIGWNILWTNFLISVIKIFCKIYIFWEGHKILRNLLQFWLALNRTKVRWRFRKILWPSQIMWTLFVMIFCNPSNTFDNKKRKEETRLALIG